MGIILDCLFDGGNDRHSQLRKLFKHIDRNGNGVVTFDEFLTLETHLNKNSADAAKEFFKELDMDRNNALGQDEFVKAILRNRRYSQMDDKTWNIWIKGMMKTKTHTARELKKVGVKMKSIAYKGESAKATRRRELTEGLHKKDMTREERESLELLQASEHRQRQGKLKKKFEEDTRKGHGKYVHRHTDFDVTSEDTNAEIQDKLKKKRDYDRQMMAKQFEKHGKKGVKKVSNNRKSRRGGNDIDDLLNDDIGSNRRKKRG